MYKFQSRTDEKSSYHLKDLWYLQETRIDRWMRKQEETKIFRGNNHSFSQDFTLANTLIKISIVI